MADKQGAALLETLSPTLLPELKAYLERHRGHLASMLEASGSGGVALARHHAKIMDGLLTALFAAAHATMAKRRRWAEVSLAAVGGYGRSLVGLESDLDVRLLTAERPERVQPIAEALLYPLWDAGVAIGHQVITLDDALATARTDLPTATALLDWRPVAGNPTAGRELLARAYAGVFGDAELPELMRKLAEEVSGRHERFGGSVYLLEPDVKSGAGGLRDLDVAHWAARARWRVSGLPELVRVGALVPREANAVQAAAEFLWTVRNRLHAHAGRRSDRLTFEAQELIARTMGYARPDADEEAMGLAVEAFMSDYYRHARVVMRTSEQVLARATPRATRRRPHEEDLGGGLRTFDGQLTLSDPAELAREPAMALRLYRTAVARDVPVYAFARDAIVRATQDPSFSVALRASPEAVEAFVELVCTAKDVVFRSILGELHDVGLLTAMVPEFSPVVGRVHHDVYHVYTVDVHSIAAVDRLRALVRGDLAADFTLSSHLAAAITRPRVLFLATLLHDVGKAIGGKDHSKRGAEMARDILARLGLPPEDVVEACHLIEQHLLMYHVATRRDLDDPATVAEFSCAVHGREGLRELYLLTVADLSTTSPTSMTSWKARMLDDLYLATDALLSGQPLWDAERVARVRERVREAWDGAPAVIEEFVSSMPERYLLSNPPDAIAAHARLAEAARGAKVAAALVPSRHPEAAELCVVGLDRPGFLAAVTAAIAGSRLEVHKAEIHSRPLAAGAVQAVDLLWLRDRADGAGGVARALPKLEKHLRAVVTGEARAEDVAAVHGGSRWRERPTPAVRTEVAIDDRASPRHTVIEVLTRDRPGILFTLAQALYELGLSIAVAKINTEGTRVADVFYVTEADGTKVTPGPRTQQLRERIAAALERLATGGDGGAKTLTMEGKAR